MYPDEREPKEDKHDDETDTEEPDRFVRKHGVTLRAHEMILEERTDKREGDDEREEYVDVQEELLKGLLLRIPQSVRVHLSEAQTGEREERPHDRADGREDYTNRDDRHRASFVVGGHR